MMFNVTSQELHSVTLCTITVLFCEQTQISKLMLKDRRRGLPWWCSDQGGPGPNAGGPGSIPGQGTRSHMLQLKSLHAATKTQHRQINKY